MRRHVAVLVTIVVLAFAAVTTWVGSVSGAPARFLILDAVGGLAFLLCGLAAAFLRPASPAGPALMACAAMWFAGSYGPTGQPVLTDLGFAFEGYYDLLLAALLLALTGGFQGPARVVLGGLAGAMALRTAGRLIFKDPAALGCPDCAPNPFAVLGDADRFFVSEVVTNGAIAALTVVVGLTALRRLARQGAVARHARGPILVAGTVAMAAAAYDAAEYAWGAAFGTALLELPEPASEIFSWTLFGLRLLVPVGFLVATLRVRARAGPLAPLSAGLAAGGARGGTITLGDALRATLGDDTLELLRRHPDGWQREDGSVQAEPSLDARRSVTPVGSEGAPLAALVHDPALGEQPELLEGTVRVLALALENERLSEEVRDQLAEVRESRVRIVEAAEAERRRVERDLHDGAQQRLIGTLLALQEARSTVTGDAFAALDAAMDELNAAVRELRELARGIHPAILEEEGLGAAVSGLARRASVPVAVDVRLDGRLPKLIEATAYFTIAEALTNIQRHARATEARVSVARGDGVVRIDVVDDGLGGADPARGSGLRGLADRVSALGGRLTIESTAGSGTRIRAEIPAP